MMNNKARYSLLSQCHTPHELRQLNPEFLPKLCQELRDYLIDTLNQTGGHFGASLGVVELTVALHYVFNTPLDRLVWDVGHQAYIHKILTGRRDQFSTLRRKDGLSGFPARYESEYDAFGVGHSSTSISAALGMALANKLNGGQAKSVAVIGDGALTAGMAFEALNHAGDLKTDLLVILNDNGMSISPNVGALSKNISQQINTDLYQTVLKNGKKLMHLIPSPLRQFALRTKQQVDELMQTGAFFTELGFSYYGPIDGHDLEELIEILTLLKDEKGPRLLHVITKKGKGFAPAEADPIKYHAVSSKFLHSVGKTKAKQWPTYSEVFGQWICDMAQNDSRLVAITPATREGSGLMKFSQRFPERYYDVGIAEQHSVTLAAGLACEGLKPVVSIYSTFLQRAYDQLIHDIALQELPVLFAIDRGGLVGNDGATHAGCFDLSYLRCIPNMVIMAPTDENECRQMLYTGFMHEGPAAVRYPRGFGMGISVEPLMQACPIGKAKVVREGKRIAILVFGALMSLGQQVAEEIDATLVNMRFVKPLDKDLLTKLALSHELFITLEENVIQGGAGSGVAEYLNAVGLSCPIYHFGLPDQFIAHAEHHEQLQQCELTLPAILRTLAKIYPKLLKKIAYYSVKSNKVYEKSVG
jgi:1-deoxy-D-xylulose-5-phosphate synthase